MRKGEKTKNKIFEMSVQLFNEKGYRNVHVEEITKKCNVSKGTFYTHFSSKTDILVEQFVIIDKIYLEYFKTNKFLSINGLKDFMFYLFDVVENNIGKEMLRVLYYEALFNETTPYLNFDDRPLYKVLKEIISGEEFESLDRDYILNMCIIFIRGICYNWTTTQNNLTLKKYSEPVIINYFNDLEKLKR